MLRLNTSDAGGTLKPAGSLEHIKAPPNLLHGGTIPLRTLRLPML